MPDLSDEILLQKFVRGDPDALGALASRYEIFLLGLARGLLAGREDLAREAVQDCWLRVIRSAKAFDSRSSFKTWVYRIVINRSHDLRQREARHAAASIDSEPPPVQHDVQPHPRPSPPVLNGAFAGLPQDRRLILLLCYHRGLTHRQAADVLGIPEGTLKSRLNAALTELRTVLGAEDAS